MENVQEFRQEFFADDHNGEVFRAELKTMIGEVRFDELLQQLECIKLMRVHYENAKLMLDIKDILNLQDSEEFDNYEQIKRSVCLFIFLIGRLCF